MARVRLPSRPRRGPTSSSSPPRPPIVGRYGSSIGTLQVVDTSQSPAVVKFTEIGDQGDVWNSTTVDVGVTVGVGATDAIAFKYIMGEDAESSTSNTYYMGDAAVDNVQVWCGEGTAPPEPPMPPPPPAAPPPACGDEYTASKLTKCAKLVKKGQYSKCVKKCDSYCCGHLLVYHVDPPSPPSTPPAPPCEDTKGGKWCAKKTKTAKKTKKFCKSSKATKCESTCELC